MIIYFLVLVCVNLVFLVNGLTSKFIFMKTHQLISGSFFSHIWRRAISCLLLTMSSGSTVIIYRMFVFISLLMV